jgi:hypothetical protein
MLERIKNKIDQLGLILPRLVRIERNLAHLQTSVGRVEARQCEAVDCVQIDQNEFQVFSQNGEDGILQFLVRKIQVGRRIFVEFGVENYTESNTRFLLVNDNWSGLVIDGGSENIGYIRRDPIYWKHNLKAEQAFITRENINELILKNGINGEIGVLSIDVDGNDYWIWEAIQIVTPAIVVVEYNSRFGPTRSVTIPYDPDFKRSSAHCSYIYYGASLNALCRLGRKKGYALVGCNSAGNNAFFVKEDLIPPSIARMDSETAFVESRFRESRDENGKLAYLSLGEEQDILRRLPVVEIR